MKIDKKLELLKQIKEVEAPPHLMTRIRQQLQNSGVAEATVKWKRTFAFAAICIVVLNASLLFKIMGTKNPSENSMQKTTLENVISNMDLSANNQLYHE